jgi:serine/threonine protein kinase/peroxiredoxin
LTALSGRIAEFRERNCDVLAISTDPPATHERWLATPPEQGGVGTLNFPLASDEQGSLSRSYGVYIERQKLALRGLFIIDPNGVLQYHVVHSISVGRSTDEILRVLEGLQLGGLCPGERQAGEPALDLNLELHPSRVLGQYRIEAVLGGGSFGTVYRARDLTLDRLVALKVMRPGTSIPSETLLEEARAAAALTHPNVCMIHAVDSSLGPPIIVMEYVHGEPLSKLISTSALEAERAKLLGRQVALGMAEAHARGIVHGDLKPANILVTATGVAKIVDFGMARRDARSAEETAVWNPTQSSGGISGTPAYMAPEQAEGNPPTRESDVFSLGLILYEMLTGRRARHHGSVLEVLRKIDHEDLTPIAAETPEPFAAILGRALATAPANRHITMAQIADRFAGQNS